MTAASIAGIPIYSSIMPCSHAPHLRAFSVFGGSRTKRLK